MPRFSAIFSLVLSAGVFGAVSCAAATPGVGAPTPRILAALDCGSEVRGFQIPRDAVEDEALAQNVRMGERWFKMRAWNVPRSAMSVRAFYKDCMKLEPTSESEEGTRHYQKGETTLSVSGGKTAAVLRIRFAP